MCLFRKWVGGGDTKMLSYQVKVTSKEIKVWIFLYFTKCYLMSSTFKIRGAKRIWIFFSSFLFLSPPIYLNLLTVSPQNSPQDQPNRYAIRAIRWGLTLRKIWLNLGFFYLHLKILNNLLTVSHIHFVLSSANYVASPDSFLNFWHYILFFLHL